MFRYHLTLTYGIKSALKSTHTFLEGSVNYFLSFRFFTNSGQTVKSAGFPVSHREILILDGPNAKLKFFILKNIRAANDQFTLISLASNQIL